MLFTRFPINMSRRDAYKLLASPYNMHAAISCSFPPSENRADNSNGRILWRIDREENGVHILYIVSPDEPSLVGLDEQIGWPDLSQQWATRSYDSFLNNIANGQTYTFRLFANPTLNRSTRGGASDLASRTGASKRIGHLTALQNAAWLIGQEAYENTDVEIPALFINHGQNRAERNGFKVMRDLAGNPLLTVSQMGKRNFRQGNKGRSITISVAQYDGVLEVTNAEALKFALTHGIGHAKGFGCGLLTIAPLRG
ncbi:type I-E CRISPR-associated protein Cas6/Cse3/CasE [Olegusella massiliensis]|uniref:type I-E CRISPR-associated protein Cas6/Cse3/CasE n=1 Tax=Olegusella massiliensis TaxID=1776381 RepID=UPI0023FA415D|nr:type I-E CRISPR-associated protein Cas6/Cse3/CasE [Olegusella massiliensis]